MEKWSVKYNLYFVFPVIFFQTQILTTFTKVTITLLLCKPQKCNVPRWKANEKGFSKKKKFVFVGQFLEPILSFEFCVFFYASDFNTLHNTKYLYFYIFLKENTKQ